MANQFSFETRDRALLVVREFDAPRDLVYRAYSSCEAIRQWYGPNPWPVTHCEMDFRPGGTWHYCMTGPEGEEAWSIATYDEIVEPERIVFRDSFSDAGGSIVPPESRSTLTFEERGPDRSVLRIETVYASNEERDQVIEMGVQEGVGISFDQLERYLSQQG